MSIIHIDFIHTTYGEINSFYKLAKVGGEFETWNVWSQVSPSQQNWCWYFFLWDQFKILNDETPVGTEEDLHDVRLLP